MLFFKVVSSVLEMGVKGRQGKGGQRAFSGVRTLPMIELHSSPVELLGLSSNVCCIHLKSGLPVYAGRARRIE